MSARMLIQEDRAPDGDLLQVLQDVTVSPQRRKLARMAIRYEGNLPYGTWLAMHVKDFTMVNGVMTEPNPRN